jgi:hypothetical protein
MVGSNLYAPKDTVAFLFEPWRLWDLGGRPSFFSLMRAEQCSRGEFQMRTVFRERHEQSRGPWKAKYSKHADFVHARGCGVPVARSTFPCGQGTVPASGKYLEEPTGRNLDPRLKFH